MRGQEAGLAKEEVSAWHPGWRQEHRSHFLQCNQKFNANISTVKKKVRWAAEMLKMTSLSWEAKRQVWQRRRFSAQGRADIMIDPGLSALGPNPPISLSLAPFSLHTLIVLFLNLAVSFFWSLISLLWLTKSVSVLQYLDVLSWSLDFLLLCLWKIRFKSFCLRP